MYGNPGNMNVALIFLEMPTLCDLVTLNLKKNTHLTLALSLLTFRLSCGLWLNVSSLFQYI